MIEFSWDSFSNLRFLQKLEREQRAQSPNMTKGGRRSRKQESNSMGGDQELQPVSICVS